MRIGWNKEKKKKNDKLHFLTGLKEWLSSQAPSSFCRGLQFKKPHQATHSLLVISSPEERVPSSSFCGCSHTKHKPHSPVAHTYAHMQRNKTNSNHKIYPKIKQCTLLFYLPFLVKITSQCRVKILPNLDYSLE